MKRTINIIIGVLAIAALYLAYRAFFGGTTTATPAIVVTTGIQGSATSTDPDGFVPLLSSLQSIDFDNTIFKNPQLSPVFGSLHDFHQDLPVRFPGRTNPFAPVSATEQYASSTGAH